MKVFLAGSKSISELNPDAANALDSLMAEKAQILIGDCWGFDDAAQEYFESKGYGNIRVYCSGDKPRRNRGPWPVEALCIKRAIPHSGYSYQSEKDIMMAMAADMGLIAWDGFSREPFIDAIMLLAQSKEVLLFLPDQPIISHEGEKVLKMSSLGELKERLLNGKPMLDSKGSKTAINDAIRASVPSLPVAEHLCSAGCSVSTAVDIVVHSPIPLTRKISHLERLAKHENPYLAMVERVLQSEGSVVKNFFDRGIPHRLNYLFQSSACNMLYQSKKALAEFALKEDEFLQAVEAWYDYELLDAKEYSSELFWTNDAALDWLHRLMIKEEWGSPESELLCWTVFKKWSKGRNGYMKNVYNYYLINDEIVFFDKNTFGESWIRNYDDIGRIYENPHIILPFEAGTIITINCLPFAPTRRAVLLEKNPHGDPACSTAIYYDPYTNLWSVSSMTGRFWKNGVPNNPGYSVIYNMEEFKGEIRESEKMLLEVSDFVREHPGLGKSLYLSDAWHRDGRAGLTEEELRHLMADLCDNGIAHDEMA